MTAFASATCLASPADAQPFGVGVDVGMGVPVSSAQGAVAGATSSLVDGRGTLDLGRRAQLALGAWAFLPGVSIQGSNESDIAWAILGEARIFLLDGETFRPYVGVAAGYSLTQATSTHCNTIGLCESDRLQRPDGVLVSPLAGLRIDVASAKRVWSIFVEGGYQKTFSSPDGALDRVFVHAGPEVGF